MLWICLFSNSGGYLLNAVQNMPNSLFTGLVSFMCRARTAAYFELTQMPARIRKQYKSTEIAKSPFPGSLSQPTFPNMNIGGRMSVVVNIFDVL